MKYIVIAELVMLASLIGVFVWLLAKQEKKVGTEEDQ